MGMFDYVKYTCPSCGLSETFQNKSGPCTLDTFDVEDMPIDMVVEEVECPVNFECDCGKEWELVLEHRTYLKEVVKDLQFTPNLIDRQWSSLKFPYFINFDLIESLYPVCTNLFSTNKVVVALVAPSPLT